MFLTIDVNTSSAFRLSSIEDHSGLAAPARSKNCKLATLSDSIITYGHMFRVICTVAGSGVVEVQHWLDHRMNHSVGKSTPKGLIFTARSIKVLPNETFLENVQILC